MPTPRIGGAPKPVVRDPYDWGAENYRNRAETMTFVTDRARWTARTVGVLS
jgi:hypothetical protein